MTADKAEKASKKKRLPDIKRANALYGTLGKGCNFPGNS
jgi:hypothetical protein